jgi:uncharacterized membrane protein
MASLLLEERPHVNDFLFLQPQTLWLAPALVLLLLLSIRLVRGLAPWRRRTAVFFQTLTVLLLVASLAQPAFSRRHGDMSLVVVLDSSASVGAESRTEATSFARNVLNTAGEDVTVQFVSVGQRAVQLTAEEVVSGQWSVVSDTTSLVADPNRRATDLASGLRLAGSLLKDEGRRRVVVVSDGWETLGRAADEALRLQGRGIDVQVMSLSALGAPEVIVRSLDVDPHARVGDPVRTELNVFSTNDSPAVLSLSVDGQALLTQTVALKVGENHLPIDHRALTPGFHRLDAVITSQADTAIENNSAAATIVVKAQPNVLVLEDRPGESDRLVGSLLNNEMTVDVRPPAFIPARLPDLDQYDSIVLYNVAATSMTLDQQRTLQEYVRRSGRGLVAIGGQTSFAKGGYQDSVLEEVMPVSSDPGPRPEKGETALILVFDRSSSMDEWMGLSNQDTKFSMAKEAARLSIDALRAGDIFGVLSFDTENLWTIEPVTIHADTDKQALKEKITQIQLGGGTSIYPAVVEAGEKILTIKAQSRHLVLMTDGKDYHEGGYDDIIDKLRASDVSLSTIAVGSDSDRNLLVELAKKGEGRHYFTERIDNIPKIVFRELDLALKEAVIEGAVQPHVQETSPVLRGIAPGSLPQLGGYDITSPKDASVTALTADLGQPLLAHWNYGLGRVLAFTSSVDQLWAKDWLAWGDFDRFWNAAVRWTMQSPLNRQLQPTVTVTMGEAGQPTARISVESLNDDLGFADLTDITAGLRSPSGAITTTLLNQTAPGRYEAEVPVTELGAYEVRLNRTDTDGPPQTETAGFTVPVGEEWAHTGTNDRLLKRLNAGKDYLKDPALALDGTGLTGAIVEYDPLWFYPLAAALLTLLLSVAVRRIEFRGRPKRAN